MIVQINTDNNITRDERLDGYLTTLITDELSMLSEHITRIEVHLSDENSQKKGVNDKRCVLEARLQSRQPIAVTSHAHTLEKAVNDALEKMKASITTIIGRLRNQ